MTSWARLKFGPAERDDFNYPIVGFWLRNIWWKVAPEVLNRNEELIATHWTELPEDDPPLPQEPLMSDGC